MHSREVRRRFAELRAAGHTLKVIAERLQVSKQTLVEWSKQQAQEIHNLTAIERDARIRELLLDHNSRLAALGMMKRRLLEEVDRRDLSSLTTSQVFDRLLAVLHAGRDDAAAGLEFRATERFSMDDVAKAAEGDTHEYNTSWNV